MDFMDFRGNLQALKTQVIWKHILKTNFLLKTCIYKKYYRLDIILSKFANKL